MVVLIRIVALIALLMLAAVATKCVFILYDALGWRALAYSAGCLVLGMLAGFHHRATLVAALETVVRGRRE